MPVLTDFDQSGSFLRRVHRLAVRESFHPRRMFLTIHLPCCNKGLAQEVKPFL
jgi:hypothetical protein